MTRAAAGAFILQLALAPYVSAQVKIIVPPHRYESNDKITASVQNDGPESVTMCVNMAQTSTNHITVDSTPTPFRFEAESKQGWQAVMIGPDYKNMRRAVVLQPGQSLDFPFRLNVDGRVRLRLAYWKGASPAMNCAKPPTLAHHAKSPTFKIVEIER